VLATLTLRLVMVPAVEGRELGWPAWTSSPSPPPFPRPRSSSRPNVVSRRAAVLRWSSCISSTRAASGSGSSTTLFFVLSFFFLLGIYLQEGLGLSALDSGLAFTPIAVAFVTASLTGRGWRTACASTCPRSAR
jgi:hypothetical protein